jgi:WD40 repeat protein
MKQIPTSETVLEGHRDSVNTLKFNADLSFLLSGDNSGFIIIWDLVLRAPFQKIDASCAGSVTSVCWINLLKNVTPGEDDPAFAFAVGIGTGIMAINRQFSESCPFEFVKNIEAHDGPVEDIAFDRYFLRLASAGAGYPQVWDLRSADILKPLAPPPSGFHPYICKGVHFADRGESLVATYTESHIVMKYLVEPWTYKESRLVQTRIGFSILDGDNLFISNLSNGIDLYSLRTMQRLRHFESVVTVNVPFQIALARQALDRVILGDARGTLQVYDRATGELVQRLEHKAKGRIQVIDAGSTPEAEYIAAASSSALCQSAVIQLWHLKESCQVPQTPTSMNSSKARFMKLLQIGLICIFINVIFLYVVINFIIIPDLNRDRSPEERHMFQEKQTSLVPYTPFFI